MRNHMCYDGAGKVPQALGLRPSLLLPFSAATDESLDARVIDIVQLDYHDVNPLDLAYTLGSRRSHFGNRGYLLLQPDKLIKDGLAGQSLRTISTSASDGTSPYAFVFTAQGSQWPQMCTELFDESIVFRDAISDMDSVLQSLPHPLKWTLRDAILKEPAPSKINHAAHSQPACTAMQVSLVQLLASWDIHPAATLGHALGKS